MGNRTSIENDDAVSGVSSPRDVEETKKPLGGEQDDIDVGATGDAVSDANEGTLIDYKTLTWWYVYCLPIPHMSRL